MRSKSRTSSSKSCESRTGNLAATDASAPNFPDFPDFPDPSDFPDEDDREGSFPGAVPSGEEPKAPNEAETDAAAGGSHVAPNPACDDVVPWPPATRSARVVGLNVDVNDASEPKLPSTARPFSPVLAPVDANSSREERLVSVVVIVVGGVSKVSLGVSKVSHPAVRFLRSSSMIGVVTSNPSNASSRFGTAGGAAGVLGGFASARTTVFSPYRTYSVVASLTSSSSWRLAIGPFAFAAAESPRSRRDSRRHSVVGDMSRAGHLAKIWPITRRQLETSTAS